MARKRRDPLRLKLDRLAEQIADSVLTNPEITLRDKVNALKVAGSYWGISRKGEKPQEEPDAWDLYRNKIAGNGKDHDAEEDAA
jgi:hypothetical protein